MGIADIMMTGWDDSFNPIIDMTPHMEPEAPKQSALQPSSFDALNDIYASPELLEELANETPSVYGFFPGNLSVDQNFELIIDHLKDLSYVVVGNDDKGEDFEFDEELYATNLEAVLLYALYDLNMLTQLVSSYVALSQCNNTKTDLTPLQDILARHPVRKAFMFYLFGSLMGDAAGKFFRINNEEEYNQIVAFYELVDDHMKPAIASFLSRIAPSVYNIKEDL